MTESPGGWIYILTNRPNGTLYVGVPNDLVPRVWEHRNGTGSEFARKYYLKRLVCFERHDDIRTAIQRETNIKRWPREWKANLINQDNPEWNDLYEQIV
jgi:putative endonuclease